MYKIRSGMNQSQLKLRNENITVLLLFLPLSMSQILHSTKSQKPQPTQTPHQPPPLALTRSTTNQLCQSGTRGTRNTSRTGAVAAARRPCPVSLPHLAQASSHAVLSSPGPGAHAAFCPLPLLPSCKTNPGSALKSQTSLPQARPGASAIRSHTCTGVLLHHHRLCSLTII